MAKLTVLFIITFLFVLGLLAYFNKGMVELAVWENIRYQMPVIALILISTSVGIFAMLSIVAVRDARRHFENWQVQRKRKKELKIQETYRKGLNAFFAHRYDAARDFFSQVSQEDPSSVNARLRLGDTALKTGDPAAATEYYLKAREIEPKNIEVLSALSNIHESRKQWPETLKYLDNILEIDHDNVDVLRRKRDIYEQMGKWEDVLEIQHRIVKCRLEETEAQNEQKVLIACKYELGRHYLETNALEKAQKTLKSVIKTDKDFIAAYLALAEVYMRDGKGKDAQELLQKGYEATSSLVLLIRLEDYFISIGEPGTIIDIYKGALQKDSKNAGLQFFLAKLYYRLEMIDYAVETIDAMDTSSFDHPELHMLLGSIYERRAQHEKATEEFRKALKIEKPLIIPYCCSQCSYVSRDWSGRCPQCKNWNTYVLDTDETCKAQKRQSSS